jgi:hypothetical protein
MKNPNFFRSRKLLVSGIFLLISAGIFAQANFSGTWTMNQSKSKMGGEGGGPGGPMSAQSLTIVQDAATLSVDQTMNGPDGNDMKMSMKYNLNGKESENTFMMDAKRKSIIAWSADKKSITINSSMVFNMNGENREMKESETWKLSDDGKTLFVESTRPMGPGGDGGGQEARESMKITMAYDKK